MYNLRVYKSVYNKVCVISIALSFLLKDIFYSILRYVVLVTLGLDSDSCTGTPLLCAFRVHTHRLHCEYHGN